VAADGGRGLRYGPGGQPDAAAALARHRLAQLLDHRYVVIEQLQVPVDVVRGAQLGAGEDLRPVGAQRQGVIRRDGEPVPEPPLLGELLFQMISQESRLHPCGPGELG
jgi:hypothetical protein